ncbi:hypothetical protein [Actinophytocola sediminis]
MARTAIAAETINSQITRTPTPTPAIADGHMAPNDGLTFLRVDNADPAPKTVTVLIPNGPAGVPVTNGGRQHPIPASTDGVLIGPFPAVYTQSDSRVWWDYDDPTGLQVAVLQVEQDK